MSIKSAIPFRHSIATRLLLVVLGLYLLVAFTVTLNHIRLEYKYQKESIIQDLADIENAYREALSVNLWNLDQKALKATVDGMIQIPTLVGVKIRTSEDSTVAAAGVISMDDKKGDVGFHVNITGFDDSETQINDDRRYKYEMFERRFPVVYSDNGDKQHLGWATIYSNSSIIYRRMKMQLSMLGINVILTLLTFSVALLWAVNRYLRKPLGILTSATADISLENLDSFEVDTRTDVHNEIKALEETTISMVANLDKALRAKKLSDEKYRSVFESSQDAILLLDQESGFIDCNEAAMKMFAIEAKVQLPKLNPIALSPELQPDGTPSNVAGHLEIKKAIDEGVNLFEWQHMRMDGTEFPALVLLATVNFEGKTIIQGTVRDISARKKAEENIRLFKSAADVSAVAIGMSTPEGRHWYQNKAFDRMFGEIGEDPPSTLYHEPKIGREVFETIMSGRVWTGEVQMNGRNNEILDIDLRAYPILDVQGNVIALVGVHSDITDRKRTEEALAESERNYREIFNAGSDAIFVHDPATGVILDVNTSMLKMYNFKTKEDVIGQSVEEITSCIPPYSLDGAKEKIKAAIEHGPQIFEWQARKSDGELFWVEVNLRFARIAGEGRVLALVRDITERKKSQELLVQSEKMMSVGGLAAGMAHEINNPLAGMMHTAHVMSMRLEKEIDLPANVEAAKNAGTTMEAIKDFMDARGILRMVNTINEAGQRVVSIVNNMLSFARKTETSMSSTDLTELMDKSLTLAATDYDLKKHYDFRNVKIRKDYAADLPLVPCSASKIQQVLLNLLRNAAQAMQENSDPEAPSPKLTLRIAKDIDQKNVRIEIRDNGPGLDEETRKRVFEPFFTTKSVGQGTGLGLSVSYFIITEVHHGKMHVESEPGNGAAFIIKLPLEQSS